MKDFNTHGQDWVDIDLGPRKPDHEPHRTKEAVVVAQGPGWTNFDLEANLPPKRRSWHYGRKFKVIVGIAIAIVSMVLVGIIVPMVVSMREEGSKGVL